MTSGALDGGGAAGCPVHHGLSGRFANATLADPAILANPTAFYQAVRSEDPVHYDDKLEMYLISRYDDLQTVFRDPHTYSVLKGFNANQAKGYQDEFKEALEREGGRVAQNPFSDPPEHTRIRRLMERAFNAHRVKLLEPQIRAITVDLIERVLAKGSAEIVGEFAVPMTSRIICAQLGFDLPSETIQRWSNSSTALIGRMTDREFMYQAVKDIAAQQNFIMAQVEDRVDHPKEDMISDLVHAHLEDQTEELSKLSLDEVAQLTGAILVAGNETTATALTNMLFFLATKPDITKLLRESAADDRLVTRFVEELLRIEAPVRGLTRMTTKEVELGGVTLPEGAHLLLLYASANDDETQFAHPREFDLERSNLGRHMTFGGGIHRCIGASLARMELVVAAREVINRMDNFKLAIPLEAVKFKPTLAVRAIEVLPMTFTRRA